MCVHPISIKRKYGNSVRIDTVPCGICPECLKKRQSAFVCRCIEETKKYGNAWFVTLTYSDEHVPIIVVDGRSYKSLRREDIKAWKREVRKAYKKSTGVLFPRFSFLISGEYGSRTKRPHYHGYLVGLDLKHAQILEKYWQDHYGFALFKPVSSLSSKDVSCVARYVAKYCVKPEGLKNPYKDICESPRIITSPGFGLPDDFGRYCDYLRAGLSLDNRFPTMEEREKINNRCKYRYNGLEYSLPLYIRKKVFYEKNFKGNLSSSKLQKACNVALQCDPFEDLLKKLPELESRFTEGEISQMVSCALEGEKLGFESRERFSADGLLNFYKKDNF